MRSTIIAFSIVSLWTVAARAQSVPAAPCPPPPVELPAALTPLPGDDALETTIVEPPLPAALEGSRHDEPPVQTKSEWYGWQTVAVDTMALGAFAVGSTGFHARGSLAAVAAGVDLVGIPAVHLAHNRTVAAVLSVAVRLAAPLLGYGLGVLASSASHEPERGGVVGAMLGAGFALTFDSAVLGWERVDATPRNTQSASLPPAVH